MPEIEQAAAMAPPYAAPVHTSIFARLGLEAGLEARMRDGKRCHLHRKVWIRAPPRVTGVLTGCGHLAAGTGHTKASPGRERPIAVRRNR